MTGEHCVLAGVRADEAAQLIGERLKLAGRSDPMRDAGLLVRHALEHLTPAADLRLAPETLLPAPLAEQLDGWVQARVAGRPMAQILGMRAFWSFELDVTDDVLTPRPETEHVVEAMLQAAPESAAPMRIVDFGVGSGAILLAMLSERPNAWGLGVDRSPAALNVAARNRAKLAQSDPSLRSRCALLCGDWDAAIDEFDNDARGFDLFAANPPYVETAALTHLQPDVRQYEPRLALDGGADGLDAYRSLAPAAARLLRRGGHAVFEIGAGQASDVSVLLRQAGFEALDQHADLAGLARVVMGRKP